MRYPVGSMCDNVLLEAKGLKKYFPIAKSLFSLRIGSWLQAVDGIDFCIQERKTFSLVGESGCGKTTTAKVILLIEKPTNGKVVFRGRDIGQFKGQDLRKYRQNVQAVFQDPFSSLDPRMKVERIIAEPMVVTGKLSRKEINNRTCELLNCVGLPERALKLFAHEFSGGQRQRIAVARALALSPSLIILDEPTSALDVSVRAQIVNLLVDLQRQLGMAYLLITHDLATVRYMTHDIGIMYLGRIMEIGTADYIYTQPLHPYTQALLSNALPSHPRSKRELIMLSGEVPTSVDPPSGCRFHTRCFKVMPVCYKKEPLLVEVTKGHRVACHLLSGV